MPLILLIIALIACAAPQTKRPTISSPELLDEMVYQIEPAFQYAKRLEARIDSIAEPILWNNSEMCGSNIRYRYGFYYTDKVYVHKSEMSDVHKRLFLRYYKLSHIPKLPIIIGIVPDSPADRGGLKVGDTIVKIDSTFIQSYTKRVQREIHGTKRIDYTPKSNFIEALEGSITKHKPVTFVVRRNNREIKVVMQSKPTCDYNISVVEGGGVNAWTNGKSVWVSSGMLEFANDNELAMVIAHEIAHCTGGHISKKRANALTGWLIGTIVQTSIEVATNTINRTSDLGRSGMMVGAAAHSQAFEQEADYIGMYLMSRAGYPTKGVEDFWRRISEKDPMGANSLAGTHPPTSYRYLLIAKTHKEIEFKKSNGLPILPNK